jgi:exopolyphosphatase / guanosine-5'-triphosphate,3'-diphosphate pyrophosphatase
MDDSEVVGFLDVGTNSIHLLVVEFDKDSLGTPVFQDKESVRLGEGLYRNGVLDQEAIDKCALVVGKFMKLSKDFGAQKVIAYGTCACREATNRADLLDRLRLEDSLDVRVIPGPEEARLIKLGVFGPAGPKERTLLIDIGGGSTEVVVCQGVNDIFLDSLNVGAVRFAAGLGADVSEPVSDEDYDMLKRHVDMASYRSVRAVRDSGFKKAMGSSGTLINLAEMCGARRADKDTSYLLYDELVVLMAELRAMSAKERLAVPKMNPGRSDIIITGGAIAEELMHLFGVSRIDISENGLKQGMQVEYLVKAGHTNFDVRDAAVRSLASRCQYDKEHAEQVQVLSLTLFDSMRVLGLHSMGRDMRTLLGYAAILHDIGEFISYIKHHIHSYNLILNSYMLGFDYKELRQMALMVRFHHKKFPCVTDRYYKDMTEKEARDLVQCAMMLKVADVLDRHRNHAVEDVILSIEGDDVVLEPISDGEDISMEIWRLQALNEEFRTAFGKGLKVVTGVSTSARKG